MKSLRDKGPEALWQEISHFVRDPDKADDALGYHLTIDFDH